MSRVKHIKAPLVIKRNGYVYERISKQSKEIELDLAEDVLSRIDHLIENGQYISRGDAIRDILRRAIDDIDTPIE
jgi:hypothetical protein